MFGEPFPNDRFIFLRERVQRQRPFRDPQPLLRTEKWQFLKNLAQTHALIISLELPTDKPPAKIPVLPSPLLLVSLSPCLLFSKSPSLSSLARLALAGYRLGEALNTILRQETVPPLALNKWTSEQNSDSSSCVLLRHMPRKIRELISDLERAGWRVEPGGKGSHRKFAHLRSKRKIILSGANGADAHHYQEKLIKSAIREVQP